jgi:eukaryotic-like serine/threonine-protein kinase
MRLTTGLRLGAFEIVAPIGAGGMGEVYRARDTRLDRLVAIKVLSADAGGSVEARQRFDREARTISQLSHPHICALYDIGHHDGTDFLVMELLDGVTLAERLQKGALPLDLALRYAIDIADALDKAHRQGIVHRDLKPANVMVTRSGVKLLDFGLAKAAPALIPGGGSSAAATADGAALSGVGTIAGTLQYMSPEQLEGRAVDVRSDIFAFGVLLFEMSTGRKAFAAATPLALASAILNEQPPPIRATVPAAPPAVDRLLRGCLAKDPEERWQTAHDVRLHLASIVEEQDASTNATAAGVDPARRSWLPWAGAAAAVAAAAVAGATLWPRASASLPAPSPVVRFSIPPPEGGAFADTVETIGSAIAPDGSQVAYVAEDAAGERRVWIRPLSSVDARPVPGTEGARALAWSPDGRSLAFFAGDKLKRFDPPDGAPVTLSTVPDVRVSTTWGRDYILLSAIPGGLFRVPVGGGEPVVERMPDRARNEVSIIFPSFLPDGRRYLYLSRRPDGTGTLMAGEIGRPEVASVGLDFNTNAQYVDPGYIVFARDGTLFAQRFDAKAAHVLDRPFAIAEPVRYFLSTGAGNFATSRSGAVVYQSHTEQGRIVWLDRTGREVGHIGDRAGHSRVRIAPDGLRVMFDRTRPDIGTNDLFLFDAERGVEQQLTTSPYSETAGVWTPGNTVIFAGGTPPHLMRKNLATNAEEALLPGGFQLTEDVSPDGKTLVFTQRTPRGDFDIWTMPLDGSAKPAPLAETPYDEWSVRFSPDGRYLAFASNESGRYEIYVAPFPFTGGKTRVSAAGGWLPRWSRDGRELFYLAADLRVVAVPIRTAPALSLGASTPLFSVARATEWIDAKPNVGWPDFDVSPDGQRFLALVPGPANKQPLTAVLNGIAPPSR